MSKSAITPIQAAQVAEAVYSLKYSPIIDSHFEKTDLAEFFDFSDKPTPSAGTAQRFTAKSGVFAFKSKTGFALMAMGKKDDIYAGHAILVCRGTDSVYDWLTDANYAVVLGPSGTLVHSGFNRTFKDLLDGMMLFLGQNFPTHIHCVGHSLGGALVTLAADWLSNNGYGVDLYTFGSPRVGTWDFASNLTNNVGRGNNYRVCHSSDPVSLVPVWPYMHAPRPDGECWVSRSASVNPEMHRIPTYAETAGANNSWDELYCSTPTMLLEYSVRVWSTESLVALLATTPLLALNAILRSLCAGVAITILPGMSLLDQLSMWVEKAANISIDRASNVRNFLLAIVKALGLAIVIPQQITHAVIRLLLEAATRASYNQALRASAMVMSGL